MSEKASELIEFLRNEGLDPCDNAADLIEKLEATIQSQQAEIERLRECLEKFTHGCERDSCIDGVDVGFGDRRPCASCERINQAKVLLSTDRGVE